MKKTYALRAVIATLIAVTSLTTTAFAQDHTGHKIDTYGNYIIATPKATITKPSDTELAKIRQEMLKLINAERAKVGTSALTLDAKANQMAQDQSEDMAKNGYVGHNSPIYGNQGDRARSHNIKYDALHEDCTAITASSVEAVQNWMSSPEHCDDVLAIDVTRIGVGYCEGYWTIDLYSPSTKTAEQQKQIDKMNANW
jgi:uncharacterized protein YkwD